MQYQPTYEVPERHCAHCGKMLPASKSAQAKYCGTSCKSSAQSARRRQKRIAYRIEQADTPDTMRAQRGKVYRDLVSSGYGEAILNKEMNGSQVAQLLGYTQAAVSKAMGAYRIAQAEAAAAESWEMDPTIAAMFPLDYIAEMRRRFDISDEGTGDFERLLDRILEAFWCYQHRYYTIGSRGARMIVKDFHVRIARELVLSHIFAKRVLILTPPRHGKSEILLRFYGWLLTMYPNHQILWVGASTELAGDMGGKLRANFEWNTQMNEELLPPGQIFGSERTSKPWTDNRFTLDTRTDKTLKSPSFVGLGSTSTVAGRDADEIGVDDLEERKTVTTFELRQTSKRKHSEIMERQEDHTGVCTIASRQHLDDIPNALMEETDPELAWRVVEFSAHADDCDLDPEVTAGHDTNGCMLFPEVRGYRWLMQQKAETERLGLPGRYELRYLQKPVPSTGIVFDVPLIRQECLDRSRTVGVNGLPGGRLLAGLDPAARSNQAAFCWMFTPETDYMVDLEVQKAGGIAGALALMRAWYERYHLIDWYYEDNSQQVEFFRDPRFQNLRAELGLNVLPHTTGKNKHDPELGISSMAPDYHSGRINLPYGNAESRQKVGALLRELEMWSDDGIHRRGRSDLKMASWFPWPRMVRWRSQVAKPRVNVHAEAYPTSYPGLTNFGQSNEVPWR